MTREEAVMTINFLKEDYKQLLTEEDAEALDMAIKALEQDAGKLNNPDDSLLTADSEACKEQKSKLDLIRREDAIEAIELVEWYHQNSNKDMVHGANSDEHQAWYKAADVYRALEAVPPADRPRGEWIDCIDRQELIGSIQYLFDGLADSWVEASEKIIEIIREEPTVPQKEYTEQQIRDTFNSGYSCGMHNEWITDEPPVDGQEVIATVYWTDYGDTITAYGHYNARFDTWSLYSDVEGGLNKGFEVIAWMPLPEPYKGGEDK